MAGREPDGRADTTNCLWWVRVPAFQGKCIIIGERPLLSRTMLRHPQGHRRPTFQSAATNGRRSRNCAGRSWPPPEAEEHFGYAMPGYRYHGHPLVYIGAAKSTARLRHGTEEFARS